LASEYWRLDEDHDQWYVIDLCASMTYYRSASSHSDLHRNVGFR
jgi:hypothetical protein